MSHLIRRGIAATIVSVASAFAFSGVALADTNDQACSGTLLCASRVLDFNLFNRDDQGNITDSGNTYNHNRTYGFPVTPASDTVVYPAQPVQVVGVPAQSVGAVAPVETTYCVHGS